MCSLRRWILSLVPAVAILHPPLEADAQTLAQATPAEEVTFTRDIAPILQRSCVQCHRANGGAPMSLETYDQVRPWARLIKYKTGLRDKMGAMPPWYIEKNIGIQDFREDISLSDQEIARIAAWVDAGAPQGDPAHMPPPRSFPNDGGWAFEPDLIVRTEPFKVGALEPDQFLPIPGPDPGRPGRVPTGLTEDRWVAAVQVREINDVPAGQQQQTVGGRWVVHHLTYNTETPDGEREGVTTWPVHEVGRNADIFPPDGVRQLKAGAEIVSSSMHLHANGRETTAHVEFGFKFHPRDYVPKYGSVRVTRHGNGMEHDVRANKADNVLTHSWVLEDHWKLLSFEPHLHAAGYRMCLEAIWGNIEETLTCAGYDHNWVRNYWYGENATPLLPRGTILRVTAWMNNSESNPNVVDPRNWQGPGNLSRENMFHLFAVWVPLSDEQLVEEMEQRRDALKLTQNDWVIGCPLCLATVPPPPAKPANYTATEAGETIAAQENR